jgi:hypothetical protein
MTRIMKPTNKLRFIERQQMIHGDLKTVRVLQQWWESGWGVAENGEWRDVPLEQDHE